jgi:enoyl-[acyl-carrier-protein] reductase (NADH)
MIQLTHLGRRTQREVAYLASPLTSATTGAAARVDGGVIRSAF